MASRKQIEANRRNARKSTGPRTAAGRAVSSRNALRHGLTAKQIVVSDESKKEFMDYYRECHEALAPADSVEEFHAERIIACQWRLRRAYRAEAGLVDSVGGTELVFHIMAKEMTALSRYETTIDRALQRARHELERCQARRRGESVAAPVAITVSGSLDVEDQLRSRDRAPAAPKSGNLPSNPSEQLVEGAPCPVDPKPTK
jgi:hypothetical protein